MRRLILALVFASAAWSQALQLDCGQPRKLDFNATDSRFNLRFDGAQGEIVLIRMIPIAAGPNFSIAPRDVFVTDTFNNRIAARDPDPAPADIIGPSNGRVGFHWILPSDGVFTLNITATNSAATATIWVVLTRLTRPCATATLSCGRSVSSTLPAGIAGRMDTFVYPARAGDIISFRMLRAANGAPVDTSTSFYMAVYGPDGAVLNTVSGNRLLQFPLSGRADATATMDGPLTLVVWDASNVKGGFYYLSAVKLNGGCGGPALSCSGVIDARIGSPLTFVSYNLSASAGDVYQLRVAREDTSGTFAAAAEVYDPQGNRLGTVVPASPSSHAAASSIIRFPSSGVFSVLVAGSTDGSAGNYSIASTRINRPCADSTVSCSAILDSSISGLVRNRVYALTASAGDTFLIRLLQPDRTLFKPRVDILDAQGVPLQFVASTDLSRGNFTAPADGTYTLLVGDNYDSSQSGNLSLSITRLNRPCDATKLSCGGVVAGSISRSLGSGVYTWDAAAGESFSVRMVGGAGGVLPSIEVYNAQGALTGSAFSGASGGVDVVRPTAGPYTIVALDNNPTPSAGSYSMELLRTKNACAASLAQAQTASGVISATAPFAAYTFTAAAGDTLALRSASTTSGFSAQMELYDPDGQRLDSGVFGFSRAITAPGVYTAVLGAATARTAGAFAFTWQLMNRPAGAAALACGASLGGSLADTNQFRYYTADAQAGDTIRLLFTRIDTFSPQVELFDPKGARIAANSDVLLKASTTGSYLVLVSPSTAAAENGAYTLAFQRPNNPCTPTALTCGQTTLKAVAAPGQVDTFTFTATGGDLHTIRLTGRSGRYSPLAELYDSSGTRRNTSSTGQIRTVLPTDGLYSLLVRDGSAINVGSYRVSVQDDSSNCPVDDKEAPAISLVRPTRR